MSFSLATREKAKLRMALMGVSGSGKTLGALYIAYGITKAWNKIAIIDTEHARAKLYAGREDLDTGKFLHAELPPPYSPERYKNLVLDGVKAVGNDGVLIIDSLSHAWNNEGGVLEIKDKIASQKGKTSYTAWGDAGKLQSNLINTILSIDCHLIVTMRSKMEYALVDNGNGKQTPKKIGLAPVQREDTEYEFDIVLDIDRNHVATVNKDTTFLDNYSEVITIDLGSKLKEWLDDGEEPAKCEVCQSTIRSTGGRSTTEIISGTHRETGQVMCIPCFRRWKDASKVQTA